MPLRTLRIFLFLIVLGFSRAGCEHAAICLDHGHWRTTDGQSNKTGAHNESRALLGRSDYNAGSETRPEELVPLQLPVVEAGSRDAAEPSYYASVRRRQSIEARRPALSPDPPTSITAAPSARDPRRLIP